MPKPAAAPDVVIDLYRRLGNSRAVREATGASQSYILRVLRKAGIELARPGKKLDPEFAAKCVALNAEGLTTHQIAARLGCSAPRVGDALKRAGVVLPPPGRKPKDRTSVLAHYATAKNARETAEAFGLHEWTVLEWARQAGVSHPHAAPRYSIDSAFFETYTAASCYWAGFISADGNLLQVRGKYGRIKVEVDWSDHEHVEFFKAATKAEHPVRQCARARSASSFAQARTSVTAHFSVLNQRWYDALVQNFNLEPAKSLVLRPPPVERMTPEMVWHYVRGNFDGDGWVSRYQIGFACGSRIFLEWLRAVMLCHHAIHKKVDAECFEFCPSGPAVRAALVSMYSGATPELRLERKYRALIENGLLPPDSPVP